MNYRQTQRKRMDEWIKTSMNIIFTFDLVQFGDYATFQKLAEDHLKAYNAMKKLVEQKFNQLVKHGYFSAESIKEFCENNYE